MVSIDPEAFEKSYNGRMKEQLGVTLVALYGAKKPTVFEELIQEVQSRLVRGIGEWFSRYPMEQIHATVVGLEGQHDQAGRLVNENLADRLGRQRIAEMDIEGLRSYFCESSFWPILHQFGGFSPGDTNPHDDRPPFERGFDIRENALAVMMGWPGLATDRPFAPTLLRIRKYVETFGIVHKYHVRPQDKDNDLFFVVGSLDYERWAKASESERRECEESCTEVRSDIRAFLEEQPHFMKVDIKHLWIVKYKRTTLETVAFVRRICDVTLEELSDLY